MLGLYHPGGSMLHRLAPGPKLATVAVAGTVLFFLDDWRQLALALAAVAGLYRWARIPRSVAVAQVRPALWLLGVLFLVQALVEGPLAGMVLVLRFASLILLAALVTLTTRVSDMTEAIEAAVRPLARVGLDPAVVGLAIAMAIRFIPLIAEIVREVREAQRARGCERSMLALAVPVVVRTLKLADDVAEALEARCYAAGAVCGLDRGAGALPPRPPQAPPDLTNQRRPGGNPWSGGVGG